MADEKRADWKDGFGEGYRLSHDYWVRRSRADSKRRVEILEALGLAVDLTHEQTLFAIKYHGFKVVD